MLHAHAWRPCPRHLPVIADGKRGDIASTAEAYARALFDVYGFDAATVNPYLGTDSLAPFLQRADKGVFVLCRTSNPGGADLQGLTVTSDGASRPLYEVVAELARDRWNERGNVGLVVGATFPGELGRIRQLCPRLPFLLPGVGAQGGRRGGRRAQRLGRGRRGVYHKFIPTDPLCIVGSGLRPGGPTRGGGPARRDQPPAGGRPGGAGDAGMR